MPKDYKIADLLNRLERDLRSRKQPSPAHQEDKSAWELLEQAVRTLSMNLLSPRWGLSRDDVEDALQQVLLKFQSLDTLSRARSAGNTEGYIAVMLRNAALDIVRRRELEHKLFRPLQEEIPQPARGEISLQEEKRQELVREELRALPPEDRALLRMRFWRNMSIEQIARETGLTYSAAAVRIFRILHRMRSHIDQ